MIPPYIYVGYNREGNLGQSEAEMLSNCEKYGKPMDKKNSSIKHWFHILEAWSFGG
jgi:hypothetical protein